LLLEGRQLKNILFVTNDIRDMTLVHQNAIYVRSYHGNKYENTLAKLKVYLLKHILDSNDVRDVVKRDFLIHTKQH
jgi:NLI interacting factor-like phosphatase